MGKGSSFEREICRKLSLWFSNGTAEDWYWRTAGSGARATVRAKSGKTTRGHYGDICATCPEAEPLLKKITFELKRGYNHATLQDLFDRPETAAKQTWQKWIEQARKSGIRSMWTAKSLTECPTLAHTHDGKDPLRRNLFIVRRNA